MDNLWHPSLNDRAAMTRGNNKVRAARKRIDAERKAKREAKRQPLPILDSLLSSFE